MNRSISDYILNAAVAIYLFALGILGFTGSKNSISNLLSTNEIKQAITSLFKGDFASVLIVIISILAIVAGVAIIIKLFDIPVPMIETVLIILAVVWIVFIVMIDIVAVFNSRSKPSFIEWLRPFSIHAMILGGILKSTEKFGS